MTDGPLYSKSRVLWVLILTWMTANALTHVALWLFGQMIYYRLPFVWMTAAEMSIAVFNGMLPLLAVKFVLKDTKKFGKSLGWQWTGMPVLFWGGMGFLATMGLATVSNSAFQNISIPYGAPGLAGPKTQMHFIFLVFHLMVFPALGEEMMFRGFLQTRMTALFGPKVGIFAPALLFALRHHPSDIYFGLINKVPWQGWSNRALQLYGGAVLFGIVRHQARSTWASWLMHMLILIFILLSSGILRSALGFD